MRPSGEPSFPYAAGILFGLGLPPNPSCGGAHGPHLWWSTRLLIGTMLIGFGAFNVVEASWTTIRWDCTMYETAPRELWIYWDVGFLLLGRSHGRRRLVAGPLRPTKVIGRPAICRCMTHIEGVL